MSVYHLHFLWQHSQIFYNRKSVKCFSLQNCDKCSTFLTLLTLCGSAYTCTSVSFFTPCSCQNINYFSADLKPQLTACSISHINSQSTITLDMCTTRSNITKEWWEKWLQRKGSFISIEQYTMDSLLTRKRCPTCPQFLPATGLSMLFLLKLMHTGLPYDAHFLNTFHSSFSTM